MSEVSTLVFNARSILARLADDIADDIGEDDPRFSAHWIVVELDEARRLLGEAQKALVEAPADANRSGT